jgi:hypothetical protein
MRNTVFTIIVLLLCPFASSAVLPAAWKKGKGTQKSPYLIESAAHLYYLSKQVQGGTSYEDVYFLMTNNIDLQGTAENQWLPIGNSSSPFKGHFSGNYFEITNLYFDNTSADCAGLFGYIHIGTVEKLGIVAKNRVAGKNHVGGIVGYQMGGTIAECFNRAPITGFDNVGGIVGYQYGVAIHACYNVGKIQGNEYVGGIVGMGYGKTVINNCYNMGEISARNYKGGIGGKIDGYNTKASITNSYQESVFDKAGILGVGIAVEAANCYYTDVAGMRICPFGEPLPHKEMHSDTFALLLDNRQNVWTQDTAPSVNSGYPVLSSLKYNGLFTNEATDVTAGSAVLNAGFVAENTLVKEKGFEYKTTDADRYKRVLVSDTSFSWQLKNLPSATHYVFRAFVTTDKETIVGREVEFRTHLEACDHDCDHHHHHHDHHDHHVIRR